MREGERKTMLFKRRFFAVCVLLAMAVVFSCVGFSFFRVSGENERISYKKKIVSVLFDDSASMSGKVDSAKGGKNSKFELAKYSLQFLVALLGEKDELVIVPMNAGGRIAVNLTETDRRGEIDSKVVNNSKLNASGDATPPASVGNALKVLEEKGLKTKDATLQEESDVEYWLVMLTDGKFSGGGQTAEIVENNIKKYNGLNTVYLSFGDNAVDLTGENLSLNKNYPFSAYCVKDAAKLSSAMQQVANKMSGRYALNGEDYETVGNKVVVNLDKCNFSINTISVIAQDCGAVVQLATYNGKSVSTVQRSTLSDCKLSGFKEGYIGVFKSEEFFSGGKLEVVFDKPVDKENVSVMLEPAIYIVPYLRYFNGTDWERTDMQYINSHLKPKDEIKVCYEAMSAADGRPVDINEIFGSPVEKVTYCGNRYGIDEPIPLVKGNNTIDVSVSLMDGAFSMYASMLCSIEDNPLYYRVEGSFTMGDGDDYKKATIAFTIFSDNFPLGYADAKNYDYETVIVYPDGRTDKYPFVMKSDGKIYAEFDGEGVDFGIYRFNIKVKSKESGISRTGSVGVTYAPKSLTVNSLTDGAITKTTYRMTNNQDGFHFDIYLDGRKTSFENEIIKYTLTVDGKEMTEGVTTEEGELVYIPNTENLGSLFKVGTHKIKLSATVAGTITSEAEAELVITETKFGVEAATDVGTREFDRYNLNECNAGAYFRITRDGDGLKKEELEELLNGGKLKVDDDPFGWLTLLPCKTETTIEEINGEAFVAVKVGKDMFSPLDSLLASFIFPNEKEITLTFGEASATDVVKITPVTLFSRIWRWLVILAILLFILHLVLYIIGFFVAKKLPKGVIVKFTVSPQAKGMFVKGMAKKVNIMKRDLVKWHLFRFIPFMEFKSQKPVANDLVELGFYGKSSAAEFKVKRESLVKQTRFNDGSEESNVLENFKRGWENYRKGSSSPNIDRQITSGDFANLFEEYGDGTKLERGTTCGISGWYAVYDEKQNIKRIVTFIRNRY